MTPPAPCVGHDPASIDALYQAGYQRGIRDALDQLADLARDPRGLRGTAAVAEARRLMGIDNLRARTCAARTHA